MGRSPRAYEPRCGIDRDTLTLSRHCENIHAHHEPAHGRLADAHMVYTCLRHDTCMFGDPKHFGLQGNRATEARHGKPMQYTEILQVKGCITARERSYGFAKVNIGDRCVDVFVHSERFDTHQDRKEASRIGLAPGTNIMMGIKQSSDRKSKCEAAWCNRAVDRDSDTDTPPKKVRRVKTEEEGPLADTELSSPEEEEPVAKRIADLTQVWLKDVRSMWSGEQSATGQTVILVALFMFSYSLEHTQEEYTYPTQGSRITFTCRSGDTQCTLLHYTDKGGYPIETAGIAVDIRAKLVLEPTLYIAKNMPFALKKEERILAEGSILEILSRGQS